MSLAEELLEPISEDKPSGEWLRYTPLYDLIAEARRQDDTSKQGAWVKDQKLADFRQVEKLATEALKRKSKDLQLAAWLIEAWVDRHGIEGLVSGIDLLRGMMEKYWDTLYPEIEDGEKDMRAAPLEWFGNYFDPARGSSPSLVLMRVPLNSGGHGFLDYQESRTVPTKDDASKSSDTSKKRDAAIEAGKLTQEAFEEAFLATPKAFYKELAAGLTSSLEGVAALDAQCNELFGRDAPSFHKLTSSLEEIDNLVKQLLKRKLEMDPDPVVIEESPADEQAAEALAEGAEALGLEPGEAPVYSGGPIRSREDAVMMIVAAAHFLRKQDPKSAASYLTLRALRWGEVMPAPGASPDLGRLTAPPPQTRMKLRKLAAANQWTELLEAAEQAMGTESGRAWLDLQRYTVKACENLGYDAVAAAIKSELKRLLSEFPQWPTLVLTDDTGTANPDTAAWLAQI